MIFQIWFLLIWFSPNFVINKFAAHVRRGFTVFFDQVLLGIWCSWLCVLYLCVETQWQSSPCDNAEFSSLQKPHNGVASPCHNVCHSWIHGRFQGITSHLRSTIELAGNIMHSITMFLWILHNTTLYSRDYLLGECGDGDASLWCFLLKCWF